MISIIYTFNRLGVMGVSDGMGGRESGVYR